MTFDDSAFLAEWRQAVAAEVERRRRAEAQAAALKSLAAELLVETLARRRPVRDC